MVKNSNDILQLCEIENFDYNKTRHNVEKLFAKYRSFKSKEEIIRKRYKASLSLDNLGIFSSGISDPVGNKVEQLEKYRSFIETIDKVFELNCKELNKDEIIIYKRSFINKCTDEQLLEYLNLNSRSGLTHRKKSCTIKVALWLDLEVYK